MFLFLQGPRILVTSYCSLSLNMLYQAQDNRVSICDKPNYMYYIYWYLMIIFCNIFKFCTVSLWFHIQITFTIISRWTEWRYDEHWLSLVSEWLHDQSISVNIFIQNAIIQWIHFILSIYSPYIIRKTDDFNPIHNQLIFKEPWMNNSKSDSF